MTTNRLDEAIALVELLKEPLNKLNSELKKVLNEEIPKGSYIEETPEYSKIFNYYLGLPTGATFLEFEKELKHLRHTLNQFKTGVH